MLVKHQMSIIQTDRHTGFAIVAMILSAAAWGLGTVMSKATLSTLPPVVLLAIQLTASTTALWVATWLGRIQFRSADLQHGWAGFFEPGLAYLLGLIGIEMTTASNATLVSALEPFMILALAFLLLRERVTRRTVILMIISMIGVILITGATSAGKSTITGNVMVLIGTASAAIYVILSRNSVAFIHPLPLAAAQQTVGLGVAVLALILQLLISRSQIVNQIASEVLIFAAVSGLVQYSLAFALYLTALKYIPATQAAIYLTLIPVFGVSGGVIFLNEALTSTQLLGATLIVVTLSVLNWSRAK